MNIKALPILSFALLSSAALALPCQHPSVYTDATYRYIMQSGAPCPQAPYFRMPLNPQVGAPQFVPGQMYIGVGLTGIPLAAASVKWYNDNPASGWQLAMPAPAYINAVTPNRMTLIGYAADGFPIYSVYGYTNPADATSLIIEMHSAYVLKVGGFRPIPPGGTYDGTYVQDYAVGQGKGTLDECNGTTGVTPEYPKGIYHYFLTRDFPYLPVCFRGTPDPSFNMAPPAAPVTQTTMQPATATSPKP